MSYEETRVASLEFDNSAFKANVKETIKSLNELEEALNFKDAHPDEVFEDLVSESKSAEYQMDSMAESVDNIKASFSALQVVGITVLSELTKAAITAGTQIYNATMGQIISGGKARALNIEAAKFQLAGLDVEWSEIKQNIEYGVNDTAYGLDAAAKVASQLVASGIKYGRTVENGVEQLSMMDISLRGISGVAAMTNSSYEDIGHLFTTVAGNGRLMGDNLMSLSTRGLNAAQTLAEYLGKTEQQVRDMVSKGQISFETFAKAMDSAFGDHAKDANDTFTGAMSNIKSALSRVGEKWMAPWLDYAKNIMNTFRPIINYMNKALDPAVSVYKYLLSASETYLKTLLQTRSFQEAMVGIVVNLWTYARTFIQALREFGVEVPDVQNLSDAFLSLMYSLQLYGDKAIVVKNILKTLFSIIDVGLTIVKGLMIIMEPVIDTLVAGIGAIFGITGDTYYILQQLREPLKAIILIVANLIKSELMVYLGGLPALLEFITKAAKNLFIVLGGSVAIIVKIGSYIVNLGKTFYEFAYNTITNSELVKQAIEGVLTTIQNVFTASRSIINGIFSGSPMVFDVGINMNSSDGGTTASMNNATESVATVQNTMVSVTSVVENTTEVMNDLADSVDNATEAFNNSEEAIGKFARRSNDAKLAAKNIRDYSAVLSTVQTVGSVMETPSVSSAPPVRRKSDAGFTPTGSYVYPDDELGEVHVMTGPEAVVDTTSKAMSDSISKNQSKLSVKINTFFSNISSMFIEGIERFNESLPYEIKAHFSNPWNIVLDILMAQGIIGINAIAIQMYKWSDALVGMLSVFGTTARTLLSFAKSFEYQAMADLFKNLTVMFLSLAALTAVIAVASYFVDVKKMQAIGDELIALTATILKFSAIIAAFNAISQISFALDDMLRVLGKSKARTNAGTAMGEFAKSLAVLLGAVAGIIILANYCKPDQLSTAFGIIIATLFILMTSFIILDKTTKKGMFDGSFVSKFDLKAKTFTNSSSSVSYGLVNMVTAMAGFIITVAIVAKMLDKVPSETLIGIAQYIGVMMGLITVFLSMILLITKRKTVSVQAVTTSVNSVTTSVLGKDSLILESITGLILSLSIFMIAFAVASKMLYDIQSTSYNFDDTLKILIGLISGIVLFLGALSVFLANFSHKEVNARNMVATATIFRNMSGVIIAISSSMIILAVAMSMISQIPDDNRWESLAILAGAIIVMTVGIGLLVKSVETYQQCAKYSDRINKGFTNGGTLKALSGVIVSMVVAMIGFTVALSLISQIPDNDAWRSLEILGLGFITMSASISIMCIGLTAVMKSMESLPSKSGSLITATGILIALSGVLVGMMAALSYLAIELKDMKDIRDFSGLIRVLVIALSSIIILLITANVLAGQASAYMAIQIIINIMLSISVMALAMSAAIKILSDIPVDELFISGVFLLLALGVCIAIFAIVGTLGASITAAAPGVLAIGIVALAFGAAAILFSTAAQIMAEAISIFSAGIDKIMKMTDKYDEADLDHFSMFINKFAEILTNFVWKYKILIGGAMLLSIEVLKLAAIFSMAFAMLSVGFKIVADALDIVSKINPEDLKNVIIGLGEACASLPASKDIFWDGMAVLGVLAIFALTFSICGTLLASGAISLFLAAKLLDGYMPMISEILSNFITFISDMGEKISNLGSTWEDGIWGLLMMASTVLILGVYLALGGIALLAGASLLVADSKILQVAICEFYDAIKRFDPEFFGEGLENLQSFCDTLLYASAQLSVGCIPFILASAQFALGSAILWGGVVMMSAALNPEKMDIMLNGVMSMVTLGSLLVVAGNSMSMGSGFFLVGSILFTVASLAFLAGVFLFTSAINLIAESAVIVAEASEDIVDSFCDMIEDVCDVLGINSPSSVFYDIGDYTMQGFINGISDGITEALDQMEEFATDVIDTVKEALGIHSPSDVFRALGWNTLAGFAEGIENGNGIVDSAMAAFSDRVTTEGNVDLSENGQRSGNSFVSSLISSFKTSGLRGIISDIGKTLGIDFSNAFNAASDVITEKQLQALNANLTQLQYAYNQASKYGGANSYSARQLQEQINNTLAEIETIKNSRTEYGQYIGSSSSTTGDLSSSTTDALASMGSSTGSGTNSLATDTGTNVGNTITTNNTYNFTQNNYSPEPIDRTELYTQTNNQLNSWYRWLRTT